jgi:hypothetical protein
VHSESGAFSIDRTLSVDDVARVCISLFDLARDDCTGFARQLKELPVATARAQHWQFWANARVGAGQMSVVEAALFFPGTASVDPATDGTESAEPVRSANDTTDTMAVASPKLAIVYWAHQRALVAFPPLFSSEEICEEDCGVLGIWCDEDCHIVQVPRGMTEAERERVRATLQEFLKPAVVEGFRQLPPLNVTLEGTLRVFFAL